MELSQVERHVLVARRAQPAVPKPWTNFNRGVPFDVAPTITAATIPAVTTENMPIGGPNFQVETSAAAVPLPISFRPLPASITVADALHLQNRGALAVPSIALQNELFLAFVNYVYPYMPVIDLQQFIDALNCRDGRKGRVSLLLFHAVMFAGTAFVDIKHLHDAGCETRMKARRAFFLKTKLLYDFDYEPDRLTVVQALCLMSYWYEASDAQKDASHWIGVAAALARTIGLDQNLSSVARTPEQKMRKRIWWSCFMRDCLIAIGTRRPRQVLNASNVPMLIESDFEPHVIFQDSPSMFPACSLLGDIELARKLAALCVSKARLCLGISHILDAQYSIQPRCAMSTDDTVQSLMMLLPNQTPDIDQVQLIDRELDHWAETLPAYCQYRSVARSELSEHEAVVTVHRTLLHMIYNNAISALHRPLLLSRTLRTQRWIYQSSQLRVSNAAVQVAHMAADLHRLGLVGFLPAPAITTIMPAMLVQLSEMKGPFPQARKHAAERLHQCTVVLERLRDIHTAADVAFDVVNAAAKRAVVGIGGGLMREPTGGQGLHIGPEMQLQVPPSETGGGVNRGEDAEGRTPTLHAEEDDLLALGLDLKSPFNISFNSPSQLSPVPRLALPEDEYADVVGDSPQEEAVPLAVDSTRPAVEMADITNMDGTQMYGLETGDSYQWPRLFPSSEFGTVNESLWVGMIEEGWGYPSTEIQEQYESLAGTFGLTLKT